MPNKKGTIYEVWCPEKAPHFVVATFPTRKQALNYTKEARMHGSTSKYGIRLPDGRWYDWSKGKNKPLPSGIPHTPWFIQTLESTAKGESVVRNGTGVCILIADYSIAEFVVKTINKAYPNKGE